MVLEAVGRPLRMVGRPPLEPGPGEVRIEVGACGVCRTDLHIVDGDLESPTLPLVPGHQVVGRVLEAGPGVEGISPGDRVGVPWLGWTCGACEACAAGRENLCTRARFTGYDRDGGFAEQLVADARFVFPLPDGPSDLELAPLLCAGLIGYRAYRIAAETARDIRRIGLYGFGSAAHIIAQVAIHHGREVFAFTRPGDVEGQRFAREIGATWSGGSDESPPTPLDAAILFAPVGSLVPTALRAVRPAGVVVCGGIHMSDIPSFPYADLWGERVLRTVANLERRDAVEFLALAPEVPVRTRVHGYALDDVNAALEDLRGGRFEGAAVIDLRREASRAEAG